MFGSLVFCATWMIVRGVIVRGPGPYDLDPKGVQGAFEPLLAKYLRFGEFVVGLASGSIVLLIGSAALRHDGSLPDILCFAATLARLVRPVRSYFYGLAHLPLRGLSTRGKAHTRCIRPEPNSRFQFTRVFCVRICLADSHSFLMTVKSRNPKRRNAAMPKPELKPDDVFHMIGFTSPGYPDACPRTDNATSGNAETSLSRCKAN